MTFFSCLPTSICISLYEHFSLWILPNFLLDCLVCYTLLGSTCWQCQTCVFPFPLWHVSVWRCCSKAHEAFPVCSGFQCNTYLLVCWGCHDKIAHPQKPEGQTFVFLQLQRLDIQGHSVLGVDSPSDLLTCRQRVSLGPHLPLLCVHPFLGFLSVFSFLFLHGQESYSIRAQLKGLHLFISLETLSVDTVTFWVPAG